MVVLKEKNGIDTLSKKHDPLLFRRIQRGIKRTDDFNSAALVVKDEIARFNPPSYRIEEMLEQLSLPSPSTSHVQALTAQREQKQSGQQAVT